MSTILVADDEYDLLHAVEGVLEDAGYHVVACGSGRDALAHLSLCRPALVLLDIMMPQVGGLDVLTKVRAHPELCGLPVVLMSAAPPRAAEHADCQAFLRKPFLVEELLAMVGRFAAP